MGCSWLFEFHTRVTMLHPMFSTDKIYEKVELNMATVGYYDCSKILEGASTWSDLYLILGLYMFLKTYQKLKQEKIHWCPEPWLMLEYDFLPGHSTVL